MNAPRRLAHLAVLSLMATGALASCGSGNSVVKTPETAPPSSQNEGSEKGGAFVAGSYEAVGQYPTPGGLQAVGVKISIDTDGTVTDVVVEPKAEVGNSVQFQGKFAGGIAEQVVGKPISELAVDKVSGSSLTSRGFNRAVEDIMKEAKK